ncbi:hypothetical protein B0H11DRAFT_1162799 [Mycena galericulata]|nr:hypothetical protein B0H11DRAFT_1162799 [Mycena galericulata]
MLAAQKYKDVALGVIGILGRESCAEFDPPLPAGLPQSREPAVRVCLCVYPFIPSIIYAHELWILRQLNDRDFLSIYVCVRHPFASDRHVHIGQTLAGIIYILLLLGAI